MTVSVQRIRHPATGSRPTESTVEEFSERLFNAVLGAQEVQAAYLGERLGWYRALADHGPCTAAELAELTGTVERYAREWLEHQAVVGYLAVDDIDADATERRYVLLPAQAEVLGNADSLSYTQPLARMVASIGKHLDALAEVYRSGGGVPWAEHGVDGREAQAMANRPLFLHQLSQELLPRVPELDETLRAGARVADVGCGAGWSAIGLALAYPNVSVEGYDLDEPSIDMARRAADDAHVSDRVHFHATDAATVDDGDYDVVFAFECIHDLSDPVGVLRTMHDLASDHGTVVVMDERVAERFSAPGDPVERLMYGYSLGCCLPDGMSHQPAAGTGTVMRPETLERYARDAGFSGIDVLPIDHDFFRFYQLAG